MPPMLAQLHPAKTTDSKVISQQQSLAVTKKLLLASFGCISYLRGLFPEENFDDDRACNVQIKVVKRGYSLEGDTYLNWLEHGIFDALTKQYLRTIVLGIYLDKSKPIELSESYTFNISYSNGKPYIDVEKTTHGNFPRCLSRTFSFLQEPSHGNNTMVSKNTIGDVKKCIEQLTRRLILLTQNLHPLPNERYLTIRLYYWDDVTPSDYEPEYFMVSSDEPHERLRYSGTAEQIKIGGVDTRYHAIDIHMNHIDRNNSERSPSHNISRATSIDEEPNCMDSSFDANVDFRSQSLVRYDINGKATNQLAAGTIPTLQLDHIEEVPEVDSMRINFSRNGQTVSPVAIVHRTNTQRPLTRMLSQIQLCEQTVISDSSFDIVYDLETTVPMPASTPPKSCQCICDVWRDVGDMVLCVKCQTWSHMWCYGFTSRNDTRLPIKFICTCCCHALIPLTPSQLRNFATTSSYRYALANVWRDGFVPSTRAHFAKRLGISLQKTKTLEKRLESEGFLTPTPPRNSKKRPPPSKRKVGPKQPRKVNKNASTRKALHDLFQPNLEYMSRAIAIIEVSPALSADTPIPSPSRSKHQPRVGLDQVRKQGILGRPPTRALSDITEISPTIGETSSSSSQSTPMTQGLGNRDNRVGKPSMPLALIRQQQQRQAQERENTALPLQQRKSSRVRHDQALGCIEQVKRRKVSKEQMSISVCE